MISWKWHHNTKQSYDIIILNKLHRNVDDIRFVTGIMVDRYKIL